MVLSSYITYVRFETENHVSFFQIKYLKIAMESL